MKTAEQLLKERGLTVSKIHSIEGTYSTTDAMREYSNQQLAEFKEKLKNKLNNFSKDKHGRIFTTEVIDLIDKT